VVFDILVVLYSVSGADVAGGNNGSDAWEQVVIAHGAIDQRTVGGIRR
jgi:hypothetical protein